jgi:hypothetical protein
VAHASGAPDDPTLTPLVATVRGQAVSLDRISKGAVVELQVSWFAADAETYAYFDRSTQSVTTRREAMRVAWYTSGGKLDAESTGRAEDDFAVGTNNVWTAPNSAARAKLWIVLRDSRGGTDFAAYDLLVMP